MRLYFVLFVIFIGLTANLHDASANPTTSLDLHADRVAYYSNRYIVTGDGHVRVRLSDGTLITAQLFSMDLKLNRFLLAGNVHIDGANVHEVGAGFAGYPDLDRSYFLPATGNVDKWTYFGLDFGHPSKGRAQPGDAYFIPDLSTEKPYIVAAGALILPKTNVKFSASRLYVLGVLVPTGSWVETFSANPNYAQNAFSGASFDIGVPYQGSEHAISALHLRYTGVNKFFLSFDQHFVWGRDWAVFSVNPLTNEERQFNLIAYKRVSPKMEARVFAQLSTAQHGIYRPEVASSYLNLSYVYAAPHSAVSLIADQYNTSLLQYPVHSGLDDERAYDHPADAQIAWTGRDSPVGKLPLNLRLRSGFGIAHDGYHCGPYTSYCLGDPRNATGENIGFVLNYFGAGRTPVPTIWQHFAGATLYTSTIALTRSLAPLNLNIVLDKQRQWFSLPHYIDSSTTTLSLSKLYTRKLALLGAYSVTQLADVYGKRQREFYPEFEPISPDGVLYPGYAAFRGISTTRSLTGSAVVTPNQYFNYAFTVRRGYDFPAPIPGVFGNPPWQVTNELRFRIARQILMDVSRTDYFRFGGYQPSFSVLFGP